MSLHIEQLSWNEQRGSTLSLTQMTLTAPSVITGNPCAGGAVYEPGFSGRGVIDFWAAGGDTYAEESVCSWTIACPGVTIDFTAFDTEANFDFVTIFAQPGAGNTPAEIAQYNRNHDRVGLLSGSLIDGAIGAGDAVWKPMSYTAEADGPHQTIHFTSDGNTNGHGFRAVFSCPRVDNTSKLTTQSYTIGDDGHSMEKMTAGALNWQCFQPYEILDDEWRSTSNDAVGQICSLSTNGCHCDRDEAQPEDAFGDHSKDILHGLAGRWYRISGEAGDVLPTSPPGGLKCGTSWSGWLAGWDPADGVPGTTHSEPGTLPLTSDDKRPAAVCFDSNVESDETQMDISGHLGHLGQTCWGVVLTAKVVHCGTHFLWSLPNVPECPLAYCTERSGLFGDCAGSFSECTAACEPAAERTFSETKPAVGDGLQCPKAEHCRNGDGSCELGPPPACWRDGGVAVVAAGGEYAGAEWDIPRGVVFMDDSYANDADCLWRLICIGGNQAAEMRAVLTFHSFDLEPFVDYLVRRPAICYCSICSGSIDLAGSLQIVRLFSGSLRRAEHGRRADCALDGRHGVHPSTRGAVLVAGGAAAAVADEHARHGRRRCCDDTSLHERLERPRPRFQPHTQLR